MVLIPDAWWDWRLQRNGRSEQICVALEVDRGTEGPLTIKRKLRAYLAAVAGPYQRAFHTTSLTVAIVTTAGTGRAERLLRWCEEALRDCARLAVAGRRRGAALRECAARLRLAVN